MRLIDADKLNFHYLPISALGDVYITKAEIDAMPTVEAEPIKHGKWILKCADIVGETIICSECNHERTLLNPVCKYPKYCENCNAKMDGKEKPDKQNDKQRNIKRYI